MRNFFLRRRKGRSSDAEATPGQRVTGSRPWPAMQDPRSRAARGDQHMLSRPRDARVTATHLGNGWDGRGSTSPDRTSSSVLQAGQQVNEMQAQERSQNPRRSQLWAPTNQNGDPGSPASPIFVAVNGYAASESAATHAVAAHPRTDPTSPGRQRMSTIYETPPPQDLSRIELDEADTAIGRVTSLRNEPLASAAGHVEDGTSDSSTHPKKASQSGLLAFFRNRRGKHKAAREHKYAESHGHVEYTECSPTFTLDSKAHAQQNKTRVRGLGINKHRPLYHHLASLAISLGELCLVVLVLAGVGASVLALGLHARLGQPSDANNMNDQTHAAESQASLEQCFILVLCLLLTGGDNWSPVQLHVSSAVSTVALAVSTAGLLVRLAFLGIYLSRLSTRPSFIFFSKWLCIGTNTNVSSRSKTLEFRIGNMYGAGRNVFEAQVHVTIGLTPPGHGHGIQRRFQQLPLVLQQTASMPVLWTCSHVIDENSPLWGHSWEALNAQNFELSVFFSGIDGTTKQKVYHHQHYTCGNVLTDAFFVPMVHTKKKCIIYNFKQFHRCRALFPVNRAKQV